MTDAPDPEAQAAEILRLRRQIAKDIRRAREAHRKAEHWRTIALADRQAENRRRESLGIPPLPIADELKRPLKP